MRLTCPNCGARYEVDDAMIPPEGRDVQCSECSTTWFQPGRKPERRAPPPPPPIPTEAAEDYQEMHAEAGDEAPDDADDVFSDEFAEEAGAPSGNAHAPAEEATPEPEPEEQTASNATEPSDDLADEPDAPSLSDDVEMATRIVTENSDDDAPDETEPDDPAVQVASGTRSSLDPSVRDILTAEAEREARLRQAEAEQVETQAEMPLEEEPEAVNRARRRSELEDAENSFELPPANSATPSGSRRDLLPDIEEINSTLRATADTEAATQELKDAHLAAAATRRRGVRLGFLLTLAITAGLIWAYVNAPEITQQVPSAAPAVDGFVTQVDRARYWLDDLARGLAEGG